MEKEQNEALTISQLQNEIAINIEKLNHVELKNEGLRIEYRILESERDELVTSLEEIMQENQKVCAINKVI
jgi:hypothetical protein